MGLKGAIHLWWLKGEADTATGLACWEALLGSAVPGASSGTWASLLPLSPN